jgi:hypothetical protein
MTDPDLWSSGWYDGPLELRPFLRAWWRDRMAALRCFVKYRVLRRQLQLPGGPSATAAALNDMLKQAYGERKVEDLATRSHPLFAALKISTPGGLTSPIAMRMKREEAIAAVGGRTAQRAGIIPEHDDNTGLPCRNVGLPLTVENVLHDCCGWCHDQEEALAPKPPIERYCYTCKAAPGRPCVNGFTGAELPASTYHGARFHG